jgi:hypothetical protein
VGIFPLRPHDPVARRIVICGTTFAAIGFSDPLSQ